MQLTQMIKALMDNSGSPASRIPQAAPHCWNQRPQNGFRGQVESEVCGPKTVSRIFEAPPKNLPPPYSSNEVDSSREGWSSTEQALKSLLDSFAHDADSVYSHGAAKNNLNGWNGPHAGVGNNYHSKVREEALVANGIASNNHRYSGYPTPPMQSKDPPPFMSLEHHGNYNTLSQHSLQQATPQDRSLGLLQNSLGLVQIFEDPSRQSTRTRPIGEVQKHLLNQPNASLRNPAGQSSLQHSQQVLGNIENIDIDMIFEDEVH
jgi:hypothetical protein